MLAAVSPALGRVKVESQGSQGTAVADRREARARSFGAIREFLSRLAARFPTIVLLEGIEHAGADALALLEEIVRAPDAPRLLWILSGDPASRSRVEAIARHGNLQPVVLELAPLAPGEAGRLIAGAAGVPDAMGKELAEQAGGDPLLISEVIRHFRSAPAGQAVAASVHDVLPRRIERLPAQSRRLLELACVGHEPLTLANLGDAAGMKPPVVEVAIAPLTSQALLEPTSGGAASFRPTHARVRELVKSHMAADTVRRDHLLLGRALERTGSPAAVSAHYEAAGHGHEAAAHALRAAEAADAELAFDAAASAYARAMELGDFEGRERADVQARLGHALVNAGRRVESAKNFLSAATDMPAATRLELQRRAAQQLIGSGHFDDGYEVLDNVLASVGLGVPKNSREAMLSYLRQRALLAVRGSGWKERPAADISEADRQRLEACYTAVCSYAMADPIRAADFETRYLLMALRSGAPFHVVRALCVETGFRSMPGTRRSLRGGRKAAEQARSATRTLDSPYLRAIHTGWLAPLEYQATNFASVVEHADEAVEILSSQCVGVDWELTTATLHAVWALFYLGEMHELSRRVESMRRYARSRGDAWALNCFSNGFPSSLWLVRDEPDESRRVARASMKKWSPGGYQLAHFFHFLGLAQADLYEGNGIKAMARCVEQWPILRRSLLFRVKMVRVDSLFVRGRSALAVARQDGDVAKLCKQVDRDARALVRESTPATRALGAFLRAQVAAVTNNDDACTRLLAEADALCEEADLRLLGAICHVERGKRTGGEEGQLMMTTGESFIRRQGFVCTESFCAMLAPGFAPAVPQS